MQNFQTRCNPPRKLNKRCRDEGEAGPDQPKHCPPFFKDLSCKLRYSNSKPAILPKMKIQYHKKGKSLSKLCVLPIQNNPILIEPIYQYDHLLHYIHHPHNFVLLSSRCMAKIAKVYIISIPFHHHHHHQLDAWLIGSRN